MKSKRVKPWLQAAPKHARGPRPSVVIESPQLHHRGNDYAIAHDRVSMRRSRCRNHGPHVVLD